MTIPEHQIHIKNPAPPASNTLAHEIQDIFNQETHDFLFFLYSLQVSVDLLEAYPHVPFFYFKENSVETHENNLLWLLLTPTPIESLLKRVHAYTNYLTKLQRQDIHFTSLPIRDFLHLLFTMYTQDFIDLEDGFLKLGKTGETIIMNATKSRSSSSS